MALYNTEKALDGIMLRNNEKIRLDTKFISHLILVWRCSKRAKSVPDAFQIDGEEETLLRTSNNRFY